MSLRSDHIVRKDFVRYIETNQVVIGLRTDDSMHVYYKNKTVINKEFQHWLLIAYNYVAEGKKYPFLVEGGEFIDVTKDGREYFEEILEELPVVSNAILVRNMAQYITASFVIKFTKVHIPMRIFRNREKAEQWSRERRGQSVASKKRMLVMY